MKKLILIFSLIGAIIGVGHKFLEEVISKAENNSEVCCEGITFYKAIFISGLIGTFGGLLCGIIIRPIYRTIKLSYKFGSKKWVRRVLLSNP